MQGQAASYQNMPPPMGQQQTPFESLVKRGPPVSPPEGFSPSFLKDIKFPADPKMIPIYSNMTFAEALQFSRPSDRSEGSQELVIPNFSNWFSLDSIHDIEMKNFPDFFPPGAQLRPNPATGTGLLIDATTTPDQLTKNPTIYRDNRNFIIHLYRPTPKIYLTIAACRREHRFDDVSTLVRMHNFLERWGLINFQAELVSRPFSLPLIDTRQCEILKRSLVGGDQSTFVMEGIEPIERIRGEPVERDISQRMHSMDDDQPVDEGNLLVPPSATILCGICGASCCRTYYSCAKITGYNLCRTCLCEGRFAMSLSSADFVLLNVTGPIGSESSGEVRWTDQELLNLLEGLEMYGVDDWDAIARHVGATRKSREDCIAKFLELPIQEMFTSSFTGTAATAQLNPLLSVENPVMAALSFLASVVHPNVASSAARSIRQLYESTEKSSVSSNDNDPMPSSHFAFSKDFMESAATQLLKSASSKAAHLVAQQDERVVQSINLLLEMHHKKLELKMQQVNSLDETLKQEHAEIEKQRNAVLEQKFQLLKNLQDLKAKQATPVDGSMMGASPSRANPPAAPSADGAMNRDNPSMMTQ